MRVSSPSARRPISLAPVQRLRIFCASLLLAATIGCEMPAEVAHAQPVADAASQPQSPELQRQTQAALADAAQRTGVAMAELKIASIEAVTWLDGSLGCPEADLMYTQALVPGYRIRIEAGGKQFEYHTAKRGEMMLCPAERAMKPPAARR